MDPIAAHIHTDGDGFWPFELLPVIPPLSYRKFRIYLLICRMDSAAIRELTLVLKSHRNFFHAVTQRLAISPLFHLNLLVREFFCRLNQKFGKYVVVTWKRKAMRKKVTYKTSNQITYKRWVELGTIYSNCTKTNLDQGGTMTVLCQLNK